jgi:hypothetical protein
MKVYSSRKLYECPLDQFIGQDIWIKIGPDPTGNPQDYSFIRVLSKYDLPSGDFGYYINKMSWDNILDLWENDYLLDFYMNQKHAVHSGSTLDQYKLFQPIEMYSTEEIWEIFKTIGIDFEVGLY